MRRTTPRFTPPASGRPYALSLLLTAILAACGTSPQTPGAPQASGPSVILQPLTIDPGAFNTLSYETPESASNGWGPYETNKSNGGQAAGDGNTLTLNGATYPVGLGVHANSSLVYNVGAQCNSFTAQIGVDDEVGSNGSVVFQVFVDGVKRFDSGTMTGSSTTQSVNVDIRGAEKLKLVVTDAGNGIDYDHADWADAKLRDCIAYSGPLTITTGGTYSGNWRSLEPGVAAVRIQTTQPVVIENATIAGRAHLIASAVDNVNVTVRNSRAYGLNPHPTIGGHFKGRFLNAYKPANVVLENNYLQGTKGILINDDRSLPAPSITIRYNRVKNVDGRASDGAGGYRSGSINGTDFDWSQFVQLDKVKNAPNVEIAWNEVINEPYHSRVEDNINIYLSSGTAAGPIRIHNNYIQGAYHARPELDGASPQYSGGGILLSDANATLAEDVPGFVHAYHNQVVSTGNYGLAIASGHDNLIENNRVVSSGRLPDGTTNLSADYSNGIYVWNPDGQPSTHFYNNIARNNAAGLWRFRDGQWQGSPYWLPHCAADLCTGNVGLGSPADYAGEQAELQRWKDKLVQNNVRVGPQ